MARSGTLLCGGDHLAFASWTIGGTAGFRDRRAYGCLGVRITFRVDASPLMGGGHAMRCLALADALALQGASIAFVSATMPDAIARRIVDSGYQLVRISASLEPRSSAADWHEHIFDNETQSADFNA